MGNYLISKKLLEGNLFLFSSEQRRAETEMKWKTGEQENVTVKKKANPYTGRTDQRGKRRNE